MKFNFLSRASRIVALGVILFGSASCITVDERLGENFIPTDQMWHVFSPEAAELKEIRMQIADSLSAYSSTRFTFGSVHDDVLGTSIKSTSFTLVPVADTLDFGENPKVKYFHFSASKDTVSTVYDDQVGMLQNVYVSELKEALDTTIVYTGAFMAPENRNKFPFFDGNIDSIENKRRNFAFIARIAEAYSVCFDKTFFRHFLSFFVLYICLLFFQKSLKIQVTIFSENSIPILF